MITLTIQNCNSRSKITVATTAGIEETAKQNSITHIDFTDFCSSIPPKFLLLAGKVTLPPQGQMEGLPIW